MSEEQKENIQAGNPLGEASVASLMVKFAVPSIIAMIVSALYNIVDQLFIGQAVGDAWQCGDERCVSVNNILHCACLNVWYRWCVLF